jgi:hypothetical protein
MKKDRLGKHYSITYSWFSIGIVIGDWGWAGSLYLLKKRLWLRPIIY